MSKFKLTLDELKDGDHVEVVKGLTIYYGMEVVPHIHRLFITYENERLALFDNEMTR